MRLISTEIRKSLSLRAVLIIGLVCVASASLLTWNNANAVRKSMLGQLGWELDPTGLGQIEALVAVAGVAALGSMIFWQEWRKLPAEVGQGRQSLSTRLAVPKASQWMSAKFIVVLVVSATVMAASLGAGALIAQLVVGDLGVPIDWWLILRTLVYGVGTAMMSAGLTLLLRNGLVPMVWLVANSTVLSIGYLVALKWSPGWFLPDAVGTVMVRIYTEEPNMPPMWLAATVFCAWVVLACVAGFFRERGRDE